MVELKPTTLRPGLLVALRTTISGNVSYYKQTVEPEHITESGAESKTWQTERMVRAPEEYAEAVKVRGKCRSLISAECALSSFGLLCAENNSEKLDAAIVAARKLAREFNDTAKLTKIDIYVIAGRIASDDVEAVRAINNDIRGLLADMESGVKRLDAKAIREAANKARNMSQMLSKETEAKIKGAISEARLLARRLVKSGEQAAQEIDQQVLAQLQYARTAIVDLESFDSIGNVSGEDRALDLPVEGNGNAEMMLTPSVARTKYEL